jgi:hypothetical protein
MLYPSKLTHDPLLVILVLLELEKMYILKVIKLLEYNNNLPL